MRKNIALAGAVRRHRMCHAAYEYPLIFVIRGA